MNSIKILDKIFDLFNFSILFISNSFTITTVIWWQCILLEASVIQLGNPNGTGMPVSNTSCTIELGLADLWGVSCLQYT